jgi:hypothetical protein
MKKAIQIILKVVSKGLDKTENTHSKVNSVKKQNLNRLYDQDANLFI